MRSDAGRRPHLAGDRRVVRWRGARGWSRAIALAALVAVVGCGGARRLEMRVENHQERPVWVTVALLSDPGALDGFPTGELVDPENVGTLSQVKGVAELSIFSVRPGSLPETRTFSMETFPLETGWLLATALVPGEPPCARQRVEVDTGSRLTYSVAVRDDCVEVTPQR